MSNPGPGYIPPSSEKQRDDGNKAEVTRILSHSPAPTAHFLQTHQTLQTLSSKPINRNIAPAPANLQLGIHPTGNTSSVSNVTSSVALGSTPVSTIGVPPQATLVTTSGIPQQAGMRPSQRPQSPQTPVLLQFQQASLIRSGSSQSTAIPTQHVALGNAATSIAPHQLASVTPMSSGQHAGTIHALQSHVPRGAIAASALTPKSSGIAKAVTIRPTAPSAGGVVGTLQIPSAASPANIGSQGAGSPMLGLANQIYQPPRVGTQFLRAAPVTTIATARTNSPTLTIPSQLHGREFVTTKPVSINPATTSVQITIQAKTDDLRSIQGQVTIASGGHLKTSITSAQKVLVGSNIKTIGTTTAKIGAGAQVMRTHKLPVVGTPPMTIAKPGVTQIAKVPGQKILTTPACTVTGNAPQPPLNLSRQKVIPHPSSSLAKTAVVSNIVGLQQGSSAAALSHHRPGTTVASATSLSGLMSSIPVAKVPPQRQIPASPNVPQDLTRDAVAMTTATPAPLAAPGFLLSQGVGRGSPAVSVPLQVSHSTTQLESKPSDNHPSTVQQYQQLSDMRNLYMYSAQPQGVHQTFAPIRQGLASVTSGQQNLSIPAAPHGIQLANSTTGVRAPMLVHVDTTRQQQPLPIQATQFGQPPTTERPPSAATSVKGAAEHGVVTTANQQSQQPGAGNITSSPRPSILRKRNADGAQVVKKNLFSMGSNAGDMTSPSSCEPPITPGPTLSPKPSLHDPHRENSQSSTDTATSTESTPQSANTPEIKIKQEPLDSLENGTTTTAASTPSTVSNSMEASPRKKPRKQLLNATEELMEPSSTDEEVEKISANADLKRQLEKYANAIKKEELTEYVDEEGIRWVPEKKRQNIQLLNHYQYSWKPKQNHFLRHSDVKPKDERRPTINELANQKGIVQKASGWKIYHVAAQMEELVDLEKEVYQRISEVQNAIAPRHIAKHTYEDDIGMVHELTQGTIQRSQLMMDQMQEAKAAMIQLLDHKKRIFEIINKHHSKRPVKKKERT